MARGWITRGFLAAAVDHYAGGFGRSEIADAVLGARLAAAAQSGHVGRQIAARLGVASLPLFHLADATRDLAFSIREVAAAAALRARRDARWERRLHAVRFHLSEAARHGAWAPASILIGLVRPAAVAGGPPAPVVLAPLPAVTYARGGPVSRLGDDLTSYVRARWVAYRYGIPFVFRPFPHCAELRCSRLAHVYCRRAYGHAGIAVRRYDPRRGRPAEAALHEVPFFTDPEVDWDDAGFCALIREELAPLGVVEPIAIPEGARTVCLHVRTGGPFDPSWTRFLAPDKLPCEQYYAEQLHWVCRRFSGERIHVQVFTDDEDPPSVAARFERAVSAFGWDGVKPPEVSFGFRCGGPRPEAHAVSDLINMSRCECVIRPASGFSEMAAALGRSCLEIWPSRFERRGPRRSSITEVSRRLRAGSRTRVVRVPAAYAVD